MLDQKLLKGEGRPGAAGVQRAAGQRVVVRADGGDAEPRRLVLLVAARGWGWGWGWCPPPGGRGRATAPAVAAAAVRGMGRGCSMYAVHRAVPRHHEPRGAPALGWRRRSPQVALHPAVHGGGVGLAVELGPEQDLCGGVSGSSSSSSSSSSAGWGGGWAGWAVGLRLGLWQTHPPLQPAARSPTPPRHTPPHTHAPTYLCCIPRGAGAPSPLSSTGSGGRRGPA